MLVYGPSFLQVRISSGRKREVPLVVEAMTGLPCVKCGYSGVVHPPHGTIEASVKGCIFAPQYFHYLQLWGAEMVSRAVGGSGETPEGLDRGSRVLNCRQGPDSMDPEPGTSFISAYRRKEQVCHFYQKDNLKEK